MSIARFVLFGTIATSSLLTVTAASAQTHQHSASTSPSALVQEVRRVTDVYRDIRQTASGGYAQFLGCVSGPQEGAMGVHYVNGTLVGDGAIDVSRPEALIYEFSDGMARLVGVEYIVMADDWNKTHAQPPVLQGQVFQFNGSPNRYGLPAFYELHVWAWRDNPSGAFVDWNINVSCEEQ